MTCARCKKWGAKVGRVGNLTKLKRNSPLSHLYIPQKVGSKKHNEKQCIRITKKRSGERVGKFKKWGAKVGSSEE
ncbi:hypothetical protein EBJ43_15445 [Escherichia coli]|nr:hypothetical protein [Escherichia coli]UMS66930.1 hypothetical protein AOY72_08675 [Escherichia coli]